VVQRYLSSIAVARAGACAGDRAQAIACHSRFRYRERGAIVPSRSAHWRTPRRLDARGTKRRGSLGLEIFLEAQRLRP